MLVLILRDIASSLTSSPAFLADCSLAWELIVPELHRGAFST